MMDRDNTTRTGARTSGVAEYRPSPLSQQKARPRAGFLLGGQLLPQLEEPWLADKKRPAGSSQRAFHLLPVLVERLRHFKMMF
jgi:hypothetical protein